MKTKRMGSLGSAIFWLSAAAMGCVTQEPTDDGLDEDIADERVGEATQAFTASPGGPICTLALDKSSGPATLTVKLTASCADPNGDPITAYYLACGNGATQFGAGTTLTCAHSVVGVHLPFVQAMDATGAWGAAAYKTVTVTNPAHAELEAWAIQEPAAKKCVKIHGDGTNSYSNAPITTYKWIINGSPYSGATPVTGQYCSYGSVAVSLTVIDSNGNQNTQTGSIDVCPKLYKDLGFCGGVIEDPDTPW